MTERIEKIKITDLIPFENHPFKARSGMEQEELTESMDKFIVGFGCNTNEYTVNGVKYIVESKFVPINYKDMKSNPTIDDRVEKYLKSDFAELPSMKDSDKINAEDMCSAAGKEDNHAVEE